GKGIFKVIFFNQPYLKNNFVVGDTFLFLGKVQFDGVGRVLFNPIYERLKEKFNSNPIISSNETLDNTQNLDKLEKENCVDLSTYKDNKLNEGELEKGSVSCVDLSLSKNVLQGIFTVYPTKGLISQTTFKKIISNCLEIYKPQTLLSDEFCNEQNIITLLDTYRAVHHPTSLDEAKNAKARLAIEDTVNNLIFYQNVKKYLIKPRKVFYKTQDIRTVDCQNALNCAFGFNLTKSQDDAVKEIYSDLSSDKLMNRIVVGDVGSGKTVVAFFAVYFIAKAKRQSAMLAPTEILARQHYENFLKFASKLGITASLLTASTSKDEKTRILSGLREGKIDFVIGTHSLLNDKIEFKNLSLVVFDEQQRFGVAQREVLERKAGETDILVLTATPIPRTIAMLLYGDLKFTTIYKREEASVNIKTRIVTDDSKQKMFSYIASECRKGKKALFVCPKLYDSEGLTIYSAESLFKSLNKLEFSNIPLGLIHGKQTSDEKNQALQNLKNGKVRALVCTSVIEVGIDVSDITYIVILNADRFGLSQLHQIRGRAGRNGDEAYCFLHTGKAEDKTVSARLNTLVNTMDGMEIASFDFDLRGGGDFLGLNQSGETLDSRNQLKIDAATIICAKKLADALLFSYDNGNNQSAFKEKLDAFDFSQYYDTVLGVTNN
ncbi:MAG TPA: DEAD/DEAH box helicase, partial [Clostridia bacterium]|nr:DEAD/DEAH box helicase [Clostridia bacterium]